ncbi:MAG TPA: DUF3109 family protein [Flavobacteriaceae bacterium]|nr:DUF3109 family protein [Flavobacteriaceae bacterium]
MFQLGKTIVSEDILEKKFVCNLSVCKGKCCVEGEAGAPLEEEELKILMDNYPKFKPFLRKEGIEAIENQGLFITTNGEFETPLVNEKECAYVIFDNNNIAKCGIEEAYNKGEINWKKPLSCHLYPVRIMDYSEFAAVNYHHWPICNDACVLGNELEVPVYKFVKDALIRKFGKDWYHELEKVAANYSK